MRQFAILVLFVSVAKITLGSPVPDLNIDNGAGIFIENKGQIHDQNGKERTDIQFQLSSGAGTVFIGDGALHYQFFKTGDVNGSDGSQAPASIYRMDVTLLGANKHAKVVYGQQQQYYEQYYTANSGEKGIRASAYDKITYENVYPGIDWVLYSRNGKLKHEFVVRQGAHAEDIKLQYAGATSLRLNGDGSITATTPFGEVKEDAPYTHDRNGNVVSSSYQLNGDILSYNVGSWAGGVTIDPAITWGTYYGGTGAEIARHTTVDAAGNVYLMMETTSAGLATSGAFLTSVFGGGDASMIVQFNSSGVRQWATYYGLANGQRTYAGATDIAGNLYVVGSTKTTINIATPGAFSTSISSAPDGFLVKFDNTGTRLWGTYYGGIRNDELTSVAVDNAGNVFVAGYTYSGLMATAGAHQVAHGSISLSANGLLAKFSSSGARLWSTYYGDTADVITDIATDAAGNVYATGYTHSTTGISTPGTYQPNHASSTTASDAFIVKFDNSGVRQWGTYFGSSSGDTANAIAVDIYNNIYIAGVTRSVSTAFGTTGAHQPTYGGGGDGFLAKFDAYGQRIWGTYYGSNQYDNITDISINGPENVLITGCTNITSSSSTAISSTPGTPPAGANAYCAKFSSLGARQWGFIYGGPQIDYSYAVANVAGGGFYLAGQTTSTVGISTTGSFQAVKSTGTSMDAFLTKFSDCLMPDAGSISGFSGVCVGGTTTLTVPVSGGAWTASNANATISSSGLLTGVTPGVDTIRYTVTNGCGTTVATKAITVNASPISIAGSSAVCVGSTVSLFSLSTGGTWSSTVTAAGTIGTASGVLTGISAGTTVISYSMPGCATTRTITVNPVPGAITPLTGCVATSTTLTSTPVGGTWISSTSSVGTIDFTSGIATGIAAGTTRITYTLPTSCRTISVLTINPLPAAITGATTVCEMATTTLSDATTGGTWSSAGSATIGTSTGLLTGGTAGTAIATYMLTATGCFVTHTLTVNPIPAPITGASFMTCVGNSITLATTSTGGNWTSGSTGVATIGLSTGTVMGIMPGTASITYSFPTTACRVTAVVTVYAMPGSITGPTSVCLGSAGTLSCTPTGGSWSSGTISIATIGTSSGVLATVSSGTTLVSYAMPGGCAATRVISVDPVPAAITGSAFSICEGESTALACATAGGSWSMSPAGVATVSSGGSVSGISSGVATVSYTLATGCRATASFTVNNMPGAIGGPDEVCPGASIVLTNAEPAGTWSVTGPATISPLGLLTGGSPGTATVTYTIAGMCQVTKGVSVGELSVAGSLSGPSEVCPGETITITPSEPGGIWSASNGNATVSGGIVTGVAPGTSTISYSVTNACGVANVTQLVTVKTPAECSTGLSSVYDLPNGLRCYPSPNDGTFVISLVHSKALSTEVVITDVLGRKVQSFTLQTNKEKQVNISVTGIYFISAHCEGGQYTSKVLID